MKNQIIKDLQELTPVSDWFQLDNLDKARLLNNGLIENEHGSTFERTELTKDEEIALLFAIFNHA